MTTEQYEKATEIYQSITSIQWRIKRLNEKDPIGISIPEGRFCGEETDVVISDYVDINKELIRRELIDILMNKLGQLQNELGTL